ncbi:MAG: bifunctional phosphopantothenoylcysteine decarboxylase/phosphopantothenate--cysteine ligase CoaBC [Candidatus Helarchaeota archaeon]|nr:bifunctional phosphopantothenoylcysteine decarboxylase/phosphopantothenate--cysteine ligase CoaBC [Candidatus Helarchaeota archaeon]
MYEKHPSKTITGSESKVIDGRKVALCISGSVAAIEAPIIARQLMRLGAEVFAVMSEAAMQIIHPNLMHWATGNEVVTELTGKIEHICLAGNEGDNVDIILVCPATANTISKIACGIDDTPVTTVVTTGFGTGIPIAIVPAMHETMYNHPIVLNHIETLKRFGVYFIGPRIEERKAKIAHIDDIVQKATELILESSTFRHDMEGMKVLVTSGPTREHIDPVRFITNPSTGKMGVALAVEAEKRGADVTLIYGKGTSAIIPYTMKKTEIINTAELNEQINHLLRNEHYDLFICAAAISDYTPSDTANYKIASKQDPLNLTLKPTEKCIETARAADPNVYIIPFKAEHDVDTEKLIDCAYQRLQDTNSLLICANDVGKPEQGFESDKNAIHVIDQNKNVITLNLDYKTRIARKILDIAVEKIKSKES